MIPNTRQRQRVYAPQFSILVFILKIAFTCLFDRDNIRDNLCYVAAYSADDLGLRHNLIEKFDIIGSDDIVLSRSISPRQVQEEEEVLHENEERHYDQQQQQQVNGEKLKAVDANHDFDAIDAAAAASKRASGSVKKIHFSSLGRRFNLILSKSDHLISDDFNVVALDGEGKQTKVPFSRNDLQVLEGFVDDKLKSKATASFNRNNQLMTAHIGSGKDLIIVEPARLHSSNFENVLMPPNSKSDDGGGFANSNSKLYEKTMIVYKLSDHKQFQDADNSNQSNHINNNPPVTDYPPPSHPTPCETLNMSDYTNFTAYDLQTHNSKAGNENHLENLFKLYEPTRRQSRVETTPSAKRARREIEFLLPGESRERTRCTLHLVADYLFYKHVGNGDIQTTINYLLALINRVNQIYLPTVWDAGDEVGNFTNIGFIVQNITIHQEFTRLSSDDVHYNMQSDKVWGAREFLDNFSRHSPPKHYCLAHLLTYRQFDSHVLGLAYVASTRFGTIGGICSPLQQKGELLYKHNTGISTSKGINGETLITRQADLVLAHELGHNLGAEHDSNECRPSSSGGGAYLMHPYAVMGFERNNRFLSSCSRQSIGRVIRRKASTCFVGVLSNVCGNGIVEEDEECDGGDVGHGHSDPCCDSSCRFSPGSQCSDRHSFCCSKCRIVPAGRTCREPEEFNCKQASYCDGRSSSCPAPAPVEDDKICVGRGLCRSGECVPFCEAHELISCLCTNQADACKLCCKPSINSTCVPYDLKAPHLPDGVLCYKGVCEKGRCEQPIQDVIERLWDVIEDINFTTLVKFLRDNIILVVLFMSVPVWCLLSHYINEFDKRIKQDVITAIIRNNRRRKGSLNQSPFLPRLFVADDGGGSPSESAGDIGANEALQPLKPVIPNQPPPQTRPSTGGEHPTTTNGKAFKFPPPHHASLGFRPPNYGFQLPEGEPVVIEPASSIALNSIELPQQQSQEQTEQNDVISVNIANGSSTGNHDEQFDPRGSYSTQV